MNRVPCGWCMRQNCICAWSTAAVGDTGRVVMSSARAEGHIGCTGGGLRSSRLRIILGANVTLCFMKKPEYNEFLIVSSDGKKRGAFRCRKRREERAPFTCQRMDSSKNGRVSSDAIDRSLGVPFVCEAGRSAAHSISCRP